MKIEITTITDLTDKLSDLSRKGYHVTIENSDSSPGWINITMHKYGRSSYWKTTMVTLGDFEHFDEIFQNMIDELDKEDKNNA